MEINRGTLATHRPNDHSVDRPSFHVKKIRLHQEAGITDDTLCANISIVKSMFIIHTDALFPKKDTVSGLNIHCSDGMFKMFVSVLAHCDFFLFF